MSRASVLFKHIHPEDDVERLLILRKRLNKSQFQFARELEISSSYLGQVERYELPFTELLLERIQNYLKQEEALDVPGVYCPI